MGEKRSKIVIGLFGLCVVVMMSWFYGFVTSAASAQNAKRTAERTATITVTAGKPSELAFTLSKYSNLPSGLIRFRVTNRGTLAHDFKICTTPTTNLAKNSCIGKATPMLSSGKTATLTLTLKRHGRYEYLCTVAGHAGAGMKGLIGVGVKVLPPAKSTLPPQTTTTPVASTTTSTTTTPAAATCANPQSSTVTVKEFEWGFTLSPTTVPCGNITFNMTNTGAVQHNFDIAGHPGALIDAGQSTSMTVALTPGDQTYLCDVPQHAAAGMFGKLTVTDSH